MKTNKIMFVGAAFLIMISCDNNSISNNNENGGVADLSHIQTEGEHSISVRPTDVSYSSLINDLRALHF
ncbi:hypothetical protein [Lunatibacter salilacus]|uniref:hypothetical protein n=1 Tax=Lunatibacter salilacus TaxID=2483804 RepID=UPI00131B37F3|nr:hypothetical protein [Lunatibacter salilacus]